METEKKYLDTIIKLIELTRKGILKWRSGDRTKIHLAKGVLSGVFEGFIEGKNLRIFRFTYKIDDSNLFAFPPQSKYATAETLEIIDKDKQKIWSFPYSNALSDLYNSVSIQVAGVDGFVDDILKLK